MALPSYSFGAEGVEFGRSSAYYALAGTGGGDGVTEIIAGSNITISPLNGQGAVTINATGSAGVTSVTGSGDGLSVSGPTGAVVLANTGVTSLIAGAGLAVSGSTGAITVSATAPYTTGALDVSGQLTVTGTSVLGQSPSTNTIIAGNIAATNLQGTNGSSEGSPVLLSSDINVAPLFTAQCGLLAVPYITTVVRNDTVIDIFGGYGNVQGAGSNTFMLLTPSGASSPNGGGISYGLTTAAFQQLAFGGGAGPGAFNVVCGAIRTGSGTTPASRMCVWYWINRSQ